jgi:predicted phage terminase large subunit-like protein
MDEADFQPEEVWQDVLRPALADRHGGAIFISTPNVEGGWFHRLWKQGQTDTDPTIRSWHFPSWTNPYLDSSEIEAARSSMSSLTFRREFGAEFVSSAGSRIKREWLKYAPVPKHVTIAMGVDLAISEKETADWTAVSILGKDTISGTLHVLDVQRMRGSFQQQIAFIHQVAQKWSPKVVGIEDVAYQRAMVQQISASTALTVRGIRPDKDKVSRFAPIEARYELGQVYHAPGLPLEFENELLSFPVGEHDDMIDSLSIAFIALGMAPEPVRLPTAAIRGRGM